ncbi:MAG: type II toxin-antitoxin system HigB family toxin [Hyphomicrobiales bacterium]
MAWHRIMTAGDFGSLHELRQVFPSADHVYGFTVFNIAGNKYRLVAAVHYNRRKVYISHVLTHAAYDLAKWKTR